MSYLKMTGLCVRLVRVLQEADRKRHSVRVAMALGNGCEGAVMSLITDHILAEEFRACELAHDRKRFRRVKVNRKIRGSGKRRPDLVVPASDWKKRNALEVKVLRPRSSWRGPKAERKGIRADIQTLWHIHRADPNTFGKMVVVGLGWTDDALSDFVFDAAQAKGLEVSSGQLVDGTRVSVVVVSVPDGVLPPAEARTVTKFVDVAALSKGGSTRAGSTGPARGKRRGRPQSWSGVHQVRAKTGHRRRLTSARSKR